MSDILKKFEEDMAKIRADYTAYYSQFVSKEELTGFPVEPGTELKFVPRDKVYDPLWNEQFDEWYVDYLIYDCDWEE